MRSSSAFVSIYFVIMASLAMLATSPIQATADCTLECAGITAKIFFCDNFIKNGVTDRLPVIGVNADLDNCLCNQENIRLHRICQTCRDFNNAANSTQKFVSDCKILKADRQVINGSPSASSLPSTMAYAAVLLVSVGAYALLG